MSLGPLGPPVRDAPSALIGSDQLEIRRHELGRWLRVIGLDCCAKDRDARRIAFRAALNNVGMPVAIGRPRYPAFGWPEHGIA